GGIALFEGGIAEMQTGEGKTFTAAIPAFVFSLYGQGVHLATTNRYLAQRDQAELAPALALLGTTSACLPEQHDSEAKLQAYRCDVTFGTGYDFGFDYLRDQLAKRPRPEPLGSQVLQRLGDFRGETIQIPLQRPAAFAIVDEADSVLIDEAMMPLILSHGKGAVPDIELLQLAEETASRLCHANEVEIRYPDKAIEFSEQGVERIHESLSCKRRLPLIRPWIAYVENALRAEHLLRRDADYVVRNGAVQIVDQQTGRIHPERTWRDGLHQAVEFKERCRGEHVDVTPERRSDARVTRQTFFRRYPRLAGMTGTTIGVQHEFRTFYGLRTTAIPTHRPCRRETLPTRFFADDFHRDQAIVSEVQTMRHQDRPTLIGTQTIAQSLTLARFLDQERVPHQVLNGVQDADEAKIIAQAGTSGRVTISTNMAGRGTDICLERSSSSAGGLHVIGVGHHEARRVDRQLAGRAGRQGDPGSCRFFVSADDELFRLSTTSLPEQIRKTSIEGESRWDFCHLIDRLQCQLEDRRFEQRRQMLRREDWLDGVLKTLAATS
ncbi:MAG: translocase, partial [Planctomycetaceae bacterium]|nr:translocase [Planctomycetaceae bacterium]